MNVLSEVITGAEREARYFYSSELEQVKEFSLAAAQRVQIAQTLTASRSQIVKQAANQLFQKRPDIVSPGGNAYGLETTAKCLRDLDLFLRLAIYGIVAGSTSPIDEGIVGAVETYRALGTPINAVAEGISALNKIACSLLPPEQIAEARFYFEYLFQALSIEKEVITSSKELSNLFSSKHTNIWKRGDRVIAFASGSAFLGGLIAQVPGAVIGALLGGIFGLLKPDEAIKPAENL